VAQDLALQQPRAGIRRALVLSGGGARGAYEVGVLSFLYGKLADRLGRLPRFDLITGTSVGAVHACFMAAHAQRPREGVDALVDIWRAMAFAQVYRFRARDALHFTNALFSSLVGRSTSSERHPERLYGMLNTGPLEQLVLGRIPWRELRRNLRHGVLDTLTVSTTQIATGRTVVFVDNAAQRVPSWTRDPSQIAVADRIGAVHAMASAAIPLLFPAVRIGDTYYTDGGLRQQAPLTPALRLGANRLVIIGLRGGPTGAVHDALGEGRIERFHSASFLLGKMLDALLIDRLEVDVNHMRVINRMLRAGIEHCGEDHLETVQRHVREARGLGFRVTEDAFIRPSEDIGQVAAYHVDRLLKRGTASRIGGAALRLLTRGESEREADLMSFLLFDRDYAMELIELGRTDAARHEEALLRVLAHGDPDGR
jgi:NTE family protein